MNEQDTRKENPFASCRSLKDLTINGNSIGLQFSFPARSKVPFPNSDNGFQAIQHMGADSYIVDVNWTFTPGTNSDINPYILGKSHPEILETLAEEIRNYGCGRGLKTEEAIVLAEAIQNILDYCK